MILILAKKNQKTKKPKNMYTCRYAQQKTGKHRKDIKILKKNKLL